jgi:hypothetical protein
VPTATTLSCSLAARRQHHLHRYLYLHRSLLSLSAVGLSQALSLARFLYFCCFESWSNWRSPTFTGVKCSDTHLAALHPPSSPAKHSFARSRRMDKKSQDEMGASESTEIIEPRDDVQGQVADPEPTPDAKDQERLAKDDEPQPEPTSELPIRPRNEDAPAQIDFVTLGMFIIGMLQELPIRTVVAHACRRY